jgi:trehalose 6-phosphate synthase
MLMLQRRAYDWLRELCEGTQLLVVSNREPYSHEHDGAGRTIVKHSSSGVVNAVEPLVSACGGVWIAHGSGAADRETAQDRDGLNVPAEAPDYRLRRVWLSDEEQQGYYYGFANEALWPLCHRAHVRPVFRSNDLQNAWAVNARFAECLGRRMAREDLLKMHQAAPCLWSMRSWRVRRLPRCSVEQHGQARGRGTCLRVDGPPCSTLPFLGRGSSRFSLLGR